MIANKHPLDFINYKIISHYLLFCVVILLGGAIAKDAFAVLISVGIVIFIVKKNLFKTIEIWLLWFFCSGFYIGQGFITSDFISKYIAKPSFLLFCIFICFLPSIINTIKKSKCSFYILLLSISILISAIMHKQSPFVPITYCSFYILYFILNSKIFNQYHINKLLNLFIAIAVLQVVVSYMQVSQLLPAPMKVMDDGIGGSFMWEAGLDDAACGTFGPVSSHLVSWYLALIALMCLLLWIILKENKYAIIAVFSIAQFASVDSKTIMGVMIAMMGYLFLYHITLYKRKFRIKIVRLFILLLVFSIMGTALLKGWNAYYEYYASKTDSVNRTDLKTVYDTEITESKNTVLENILDWGKIKGFTYVFSDFIDEGNLDFFLGYGIQGYNYNDKQGYILSKDTQLMQTNNSTNSNSGLITHFATLGVIGFILLSISLYFWYNDTYKVYCKNQIDLLINSIVKIYMLFTLLAAFLYPITFVSIPFIAFGSIIALLKNYSRKYEIQKSLSFNK